MDCNQLAVDIDNELVVVHNWVRPKSFHSPGADRMAACNVVSKPHALSPLATGSVALTMLGAIHKTSWGWAHGACCLAIKHRHILILMAARLTGL